MRSSKTRVVDSLDDRLGFCMSNIYLGNEIFVAQACRLIERNHACRAVMIRVAL